MATAIEIETIEAKILEWLRTDPRQRVQPPMHTYLQTIRSYAGDFEQEVLAGVPTLAPAAFTIFAGAEFRDLSNVEQEADFRFSIYLVSQTLKGNEGARRGYPGHIGAYRMLTDVRKLLVGEQFNIPSFPPMLMVSHAVIMNTMAISVYDAMFITKNHIIPQGQ